MLLQNNRPQNNIKVGGVETFSTVDWPDKMAAVVFMQGCPWRCPFCYNTALQPVDSGIEFNWEKFVEFLAGRKGMLDAVVFSGGEPLLQSGLSGAIAEVRDLGFEIGLHTGGYHSAHLAKVVPLLNWVGLDIKAPFEAERYKIAVGGANHLNEVEKSLELLVKGGLDFECRTTCDPRILSVEDVLAIAVELKKRGVKKYFLQKYRPVESDKTTQDGDCEKFFCNKGFVAELSGMFLDFGIRK